MISIYKQFNCVTNIYSQAPSSSLSGWHPSIQYYMSGACKQYNLFHNENECFFFFKINLIILCNECLHEPIDYSFKTINFVIILWFSR